MKKNIKSSVKEIKSNLPKNLLRLGICLLVVGLFCFVSGYHNLDLSVNYLRIAYIFDLDYSIFFDTSAGGKVYHADEWYIIGLNMMNIGFFIFGFGAVLTGWGYANIENKK